MEKLTGIVQRVTYHNSENGWSVLRVSPLDKPYELKTVTVHQANVFAGATMEFEGEWVQHPKYGEQFKSSRTTERKPASASALEKYLGSGLIYGVGPKIARRIVKHFGKDTLEVFENNMERLKEVSGIAQTKLEQIEASWTEHREIRNVMLFLQEYGVSTLFAVKIFKTYGNDAIAIVKNNPYQLAKDIYGIGFFSADKIALSMGMEKDSEQRLRAAVAHVLSAAREQGHCYLELENILTEVEALLKEEHGGRLVGLVALMEREQDLKVRWRREADTTEPVKCYYSKSLYYDEQETAACISAFLQRKVNVDQQRVHDWLQRFNQQQTHPLSEEQFAAVAGICGQSFSILTGGPGCGKTTTTRALVRLLQAMKKRITLAAPTGRAAQRMGEVIGREAQTIHRLLVWQPHSGQFKKNREEPLATDFVIIDECSMLDISIAASLLQAIPPTAQVLFIGDPNQLPSVGPGNVLKDLIEGDQVPCYHLRKVFRQASESHIIKFAHQMIQRRIPPIESPLHVPDIWEKKVDCLFIDSEEATKEQSLFIQKIRGAMRYVIDSQGQAFVREQGPEGTSEQYKSVVQEDDIYIADTSEAEIEELRKTGARSYVFNIPRHFIQADLSALLKSKSDAEALRNLVQGIHPWSSLHYGLTAAEMVVHLYVKTLKEKMGTGTEVQVLTPMTVGSMGTRNLNLLLQQAANPARIDQPEVQVGDRLFRKGDRVIQRRNNYDLEVFNGDIGRISAIDNQSMTLEVSFPSATDTRRVQYRKEDLLDLDLAYAITIHKSQGSEFDAVILPVVMQHFNMLFQNLIYTGLTRAKKMALFVGSRKALGIAIKNIDMRTRKTMLKTLVGTGTGKI